MTTTGVDQSLIAFQFASLQGLPVSHAMSGRVAGLPWEGTTGHGRDTDPSAIEANRRAFIQSAQMCPSNLTVPRQTHSANVTVATIADRGRGLYPAFDGFPETDAMVTNDLSVALGVIVADCVPLVLYDRRKHALGVVHSGWRGTVGQIGSQTLAEMQRTFGSDPADVMAGIGPSIGPCCYEVGDEVIDRWTDQKVRDGNAAILRRESSYHFDLWTANRLSLVDSGVPPHQIEVSGVCVRCEVDRFFSYRATLQGVASPGRMLMVAQLQPRDDESKQRQETDR